MGESSGLLIRRMRVQAPPGLIYRRAGAEWLPNGLLPGQGEGSIPSGSNAFSPVVTGETPWRPFAARQSVKESRQAEAAH